MNKGQLELRIQQVENIIKSYLPKAEGYQKTVIEAMRYSILSGGKRLRPLLMQETFFMTGGRGRIVEPFMAALEMIHTYSLIHDDLPSMDNDDYRRGRKTTHVVYGEGMAVLAGDALLNYAFETAAGAFSMVDEQNAGEYRRVAKAMEILGRKAGIYGMVGGQTADVEAEKKNLEISDDKLYFIHKNKTAALIEAALMIGAVLSGAPDEKVGRLEKCAENIGIAFQIQDDILDITSTTEELGKPAGSDARNQKQTYVTIYGMKKAKEDVEILSKQAVEILEECGQNGSELFMKELILSLIHRRY